MKEGQSIKKIASVKAGLKMNPVTGEIIPTYGMALEAAGILGEILSGYGKINLKPDTIKTIIDVAVKDYSYKLLANDQVIGCDRNLVKRLVDAIPVEEIERPNLV